MEHLKEILLGIYRLNLIGGDKEVNRVLREKFPEWKYSFDKINLEVLAQMGKKKLVEKVNAGPTDPLPQLAEALSPEERLLDVIHDPDSPHNPERKVLDPEEEG